MGFFLRPFLLFLKKKIPKIRECLESAVACKYILFTYTHEKRLIKFMRTLMVVVAGFISVP
jgi:hypothetical protein